MDCCQGVIPGPAREYWPAERSALRLFDLNFMLEASDFILVGAANQNPFQGG